VQEGIKGFEEYFSRIRSERSKGNIASITSSASDSTYNSSAKNLEISHSRFGNPQPPHDRKEEEKKRLTT